MKNIISYNFEYSKHKGINSTNLIIGGSSFYSGAPYFTSLASLKSGFDLSYIMTQEEAIIPLKVLIPESIVLPIKKIDWILDKIDICIIGPGLGRIRGDLVNILKTIIAYLVKRDIFLIFDGDGLFILKQITDTIDGYEKVVLTPNYNEAQNIINDNNWNVIEKGESDKCYNNDLSVIVNDLGSEKRCGGLGDILCGILAILLVRNSEDVLQCMETACRLLRKASHLAFIKKKRGLMARDVIEKIEDAFEFFRRIH